MRRTPKTSRDPLGFSLAEVLAALTIGAMVLVATLSIYNRAERSAAAITHKLDSYRLPGEILQRISEDLDKVFAAGSDTKITIENKLDHLYPTARLTILKTIYDSKNNKQTFERIVWQSSYDYDNDTDSLVLYRGHSGIGVEDKLLDEPKEDWERELFVPVCTGVTFFKIQVPIGEDFQDKWTSTTLPHGIVVTISFAEPFKTVTGTLDVPDTEKITRTIAVDRTRKIKFTFAKKEDEEDEEDKREGEEDKREGEEDKREGEEDIEQSNE